MAFLRIHSLTHRAATSFILLAYTYLLAIFLMVVLGCASKREPTQSLQNNLTIKQELLALEDDVLKNELKFYLPISEGAFLQTRLDLFFGKVLKMRNYTFVTKEGISYRGQSETFDYLVKRKTTSKGIFLDVSCISRAPRQQHQATINAKNLARLLAEGYFEHQLFIP